MRYAQMRQTHIYKYQSISTHMFVLKVNLIFAWEMRRYKKPARSGLLGEERKFMWGFSYPCFRICWDWLTKTFP
ncbi:hypothetical protein M2403_002011 [Rahnella sp. BIGb0603]|nr:hypothetical protein [Rahnella sp. BIGb0603]